MRPSSCSSILRALLSLASLALGPTALVASTALLASTAQAQPCTPVPSEGRYCGTDLVADLGGPAGFGERGQCLGPTDDGSSRPLDITSAFPDGLNFFGTTYRELFLNTNGNITFNATVRAYTPRPFPVAAQPMIAPYWADVDTRGTACVGSCVGDCLASCANPADNAVWYDLSPGRAVFTWDNVGYYSCSDDRRMSFQLILTSAPGCGTGMSESDFSVEMRFNRCEWDTGYASGGTGGRSTLASPELSCTSDADCGSARVHCELSEGRCYDGVPGQSGFDAGNLRDFVMIPGSRTNDIAWILCNDSNVAPSEPGAAPGVWRFLVRGGVVICPDAGLDCAVPGQQGLCAIGRTSCVGGGTVCAPTFTASTERCDNLDNDCDGEIDDGAALCPEPQVCASGRCVEPCFEGSCLEGQSCTAEGICVETSCIGVSCLEGERCEGGACRASCEGVSCPLGQTCLAGRCVDRCATIMCDPSCEACDAGVCVARCNPTSCAAGETCNADGLCRASACGAGCPAGQVCGDTGCVDACVGVTCPAGEICELGVCVMEPPPPPPDAAVYMDDAAVPEPDAFVINYFDARPPDAATTRPPEARAGCACAAAGPVSTGRAALAGLALGMLGLVLARRRQR